MKPKKPKPDFKNLAKIARSTGNVLTRAQLRDCLLTDSTIKTLLSKRLLSQLQRGVYMVGIANPTWEQSARATFLAGGDLTMLGGESALGWWGVLTPNASDTIELIADRSDGPQPTNTRVRRPTRRIDSVVRRGVRVSSVEDALLDYAARHDRKEVEIAVEAALLSRRTAERRLWKVVALNSRKGVRGVALLRDVLERRPKGKPAKSILEIEVLDVIRSAALPLPTRNHDTVDGNGDAREIDLCYVEQMTAIEADSKRWHSTATQTSEDICRQRALEAVGFTFIRVTWADVFTRPEWIVEQVRTLLGGVVAA